MDIKETMVQESTFDVYEIRKEFPILDQEVNGKPLIYFDNAATTQKPLNVINAITDYYQGYNSNVHRGVHTLAGKATEAYENTRYTVKEFLNSASIEEIIFTYGTTDSINMVSQTFGKRFIQKGDEIIISGLEHHSNIVPWQMVCEEKGSILKVIPVLDNGDLDMDAYKELLTSKTKFVSVAHVSNTLGTINPVKKIIDLAHQAGAKVLLDGAQAAPHMDIDVQTLDCDFYVFSSHKSYGPTGVGVLYGKKELLEELPPYRGGGEMIKEVTFEKTTFNDLPFKFEAGTPNIADIIALKASLDYINSKSRKILREHEANLLDVATGYLKSIGRIRVIGEALEKIGILSFLIDGVHPFDVGMMLDSMGIAVRTGHHCTQPLMQRFGIEGTVRASFSMYNTEEEIVKMSEGLEKITKRFLK